MERERLTNQQVIVRLMNHSPQGPLMHAFMFTALEAFAKHMLADREATRELMAGGITDPEAWMACAEEVLSIFNDHMNDLFPPEMMQ